jgi:two-component system response regulator HydG
MKNILILDDVVTLGIMLQTWFSKRGFEVKTCINIFDAKKAISQEQPELLISDYRLPDGTGLELLRWVKEFYPATVVIMMTSYAEISSAVECIRAGAYDYVSKPVNPEELLEKINNFKIDSPAPDSEPQTLSRPRSRKNERFIKGCSPEYTKVYEYVDLIAPTDLSVLINGESGAGKEHIALLIHEKSKRADKPFVSVDCGTMSKELSNSEFFGHIKGSFTGAINNKRGYFVEANGGTLFLDEIGNLSIDTQIQLLRALQERKIKPVGGSREISVDIRVITATNENLEERTKQGAFRVDLYHRINQFVINIPNLNTCKADIPLFAHHFLNLANIELGKNISGFDEKTMKLLMEYEWPGNLRELKNVVYRLALVSSQSVITTNLLKETAPNLLKK